MAQAIAEPELVAVSLRYAVAKGQC